MAYLDPTVTLRAYAKINWTLELLRRRPDGYHEVRTMLQNVSLWDRVTVTATTEPDLVVQCAAPDVPEGPGNLCYRAAALLREAAGVRSGARIVIDKDVPVGAGLGGGSSDAAATLIALNQVWNLGLPAEELAILVATIGADVPFFLRGGTAVGTGRGDRVRPVPGPVGRPLLLALAPFPLATAAVYGQVREFRADAGEHTRRLEELLRIADCGLRIADCAATLINDLEEPAFALRPELRTCLFDLRQADVIAAGMSGSGPTLFALLKETDSPSTRARIARWEGDWQVRLVRTVDRGWLEEGPECPWQPFNGGLILP